MNRQETYDKVRDHLMNQGRRSGERFECRYRGDDGLMCAIGTLIPDSLYRRRFENHNIWGLSQGVKKRLGVSEDGDMTFLYGLQGIHDTREPMDWAAALYDFALVNGLRP